MFYTNVEFIQFKYFVKGEKSQIKAVTIVEQNGRASGLQLFLPLLLNNCEGREPIFKNKGLNSNMPRTPKLSALSLMALAIESDR